MALLFFSNDIWPFVKIAKISASNFHAKKYLLRPESGALANSQTFINADQAVSTKADKS